MIAAGVELARAAVAEHASKHAVKHRAEGFEAVLLVKGPDHRAVRVRGDGATLELILQKIRMVVDLPVPIRTELICEMQSSCGYFCTWQP